MSSPSPSRQSSFISSISSIHRAGDSRSSKLLSPVCCHDGIATLEKSNFISQNCIKEFNQRGSSFHSTPSSRPGHGRRIPGISVMQPLPFNGIHAHSFSKSGKLTQDRSTKERFQRRQESHVTAETAQDIIGKFTSCVSSQASSTKQPQRRRRATSFSETRFEPKEKPRRRATDCAVTYPDSTVTQETQEKRQHVYLLGDTIRSSSHMIIEPTPKRAAEAATLLKKHDYAFIRRSDGSYSYAIVACRSSRPKNGATVEEEEYIMFVVDEKGSNKVVGQKHWGDVVRLTRGLTSIRPTVADHRGAPT